jgi:CRISPR-associated protein Csy3
MAETLSGKNDSLILDVTAFAKIGRAQDVYPSEELVLKENSLTKRKYSKSKFLYYRNGGAAMHSQKIGNAIRKIDTWYNQENQCTPIPIEVYGSVTQLGEAFRRNKNDFYTIFDSWMLSDEVISKEEQHYCMAMLVRGGIFGEKDKTKNKKEDSSE